MRVLVHRFILLAFTGFCLVYLVDAAPPNPVSAVAALEPRKPPQKAPPGCPTARYLHSLSEYFLRSFYDPDIKKHFGSYEGYTQDWFWDQFSITDTTLNYPAEQKGKKLAAPGRWAKSRREFSNILTEVIPKIRNVLGDIHWDENDLYFGGMEGNDCLTGFWKATYIATLKKAYGGKKKGTKVRWTHYHTIKVGKLDPNIGFQILNATVRTDWSAFYKS